MEMIHERPVFLTELKLTPLLINRILIILNLLVINKTRLISHPPCLDQFSRCWILLYLKHLTFIYRTVFFFNHEIQFVLQQTSIEFITERFNAQLKYGTSKNSSYLPIKRYFTHVAQQTHRAQRYITTLLSSTKSFTSDFPLQKKEKENDLFLIILRDAVADFTEALIHYEAFTQIQCRLNNFKRALYTVLPPQHQTITASSTWRRCVHIGAWRNF